MLRRLLLLLPRPSRAGSWTAARRARGFKGLQHSVSQEELGVALAFLQRVLPSSAQPSAGKPLGEMSVRELKAAIERAGLGQQAVGLLEKKDMAELLRKASGKDDRPLVHRRRLGATRRASCGARSPSGQFCVSALTMKWLRWMEMNAVRARARRARAACSA
jgi:hypothetical protein